VPRWCFVFFPHSLPCSHSRVGFIFKGGLCNLVEWLEAFVGCGGGIRSATREVPVHAVLMCLGRASEIFVSN
jgi:hypothetical protein